MKILITGSSGYIGSCLFSFLKSKKNKILGIDKKKTKLNKQNNFIKCNFLDFKKSLKIINNYKPDLIIHLAAESTLDNISNKKKYVLNNVHVTRNILKISKKIKLKYFIFSSTASVYAKLNKPLKEEYIKKSNNIYGKTKVLNERDIIKEFKNNKTKYVILRFFNVCSSLKKPRIGEFHSPETHFFPLLIQKIIQKKTIKIYGNNFNTKDGTCVRDYIHILDICHAINKSIHYLKKNKNKSLIANLGTKKGLSILEILNFMKKKFQFNYKFTRKRKGDNDMSICNNTKAHTKLKWKPRFSSINRIVEDEIGWFRYFFKKGMKRKSIY
jgi:UDP-glucose 4-epimerase